MALIADSANTASDLASLADALAYTKDALLHTTQEMCAAVVKGQFAEAAELAERISEATAQYSVALHEAANASRG